MEMQQLLMSKATEAIAALWLNQLEIIHKSTGIQMDVLVNCLNMQVNVEPAREPEKKKRAPAKKKEPAAPAVEPVREPVEPDAAVEPVVEKKKRAPAKKKQEEVLDDKAKKEQSEKEAQEKKAKKEAEALEKKGKKAAPKAQEKKGKKAVAAVAAEPLPKFGANEQVRYVRPNGKTVDVVVEYAIQHDDYVEYRLQVVGKNETIFSREESLFELEEKVADPDSSDDDDADTVKMAASPEASPCKSWTDKPWEEVVINGTPYLIDGDDTAYLKSSNKMAGKYDRVRHTIGQAQPEDDSECGESDEDELPGDMSDLSGSESGSESDSESD